MDMSEFTAGKYQKAADFEGEEPREVVIRAVKKEAVGQKQELKPVVYLQGEDRGIILNKTNSKMLVALLGKESNGWVGQRVMLAVQLVDFQGESVWGFRFAPIKRKPVKPAPAAVPKPPVVDEAVELDTGGDTSWNYGEDSF